MKFGDPAGLTANAEFEFDTERATVGLEKA
jgi:hypothetical protein